MNKLIMVSLAILASVGCKGRDADPINNARVAAKDKDLQGTFESACNIKPIGAIVSGVATGGGPSIKSEKIQYSFDGLNITRRELYFTDGSCATQAFQLEERGTFDIDKDKKTNDGGYNIDMSFKKVLATAQSDDGVTIANALKWCRNGAWDKSEKDVTPTSEDATCYGVKEPRNYYNVYRVDAGNLTLGADDKAVNKAEQRPSKLTTDKFTKK